METSAVENSADTAAWVNSCGAKSPWGRPKWLQKATNLLATLILVDRSSNTAVPSSDVTFWSISNAPCLNDHDSATRTPAAGLQSRLITLTFHRGTVLGKGTKMSPVRQTNEKSQYRVVIPNRRFRIVSMPPTDFAKASSHSRPRCGTSTREVSRRSAPQRFSSSTECFSCGEDNGSAYKC